MAKLQQALAASGTSVSGTVEPIGLDFDGTNDYLSRSTDLVGNADGKTFTFSCWVYNATTTHTSTVYVSTSPDFGFYYIIEASGDIQLACHNSANTRILNIVASANFFPINTFSHVLVSVDLTNTSNRHFYINDEVASVDWSTYINDNINFTNATHKIGRANNTNNTDMEGRLAHVYLDYTYRDLSLEANRRLFNQIDPDRGLIPSDTVPANPILYLPMDDPDDQGRNDGTGGNFTVNGNPSQSERGANQYNAVASEFDGSTDYLSRAGLIGEVDTKVLTGSFHYRNDNDSAGYIYGSNAGGDVNIINVAVASLKLQVDFRIPTGASYSMRFSTPTDTITIGKNFYVSFSVDVTDVNKRHVYINGEDYTGIVTWDSYLNADMTLTGFTHYINGYKGISFSNTITGDFYLDTSYIDLSTDNPFWDSDTNKPKYLGDDGSVPTGSQPLIYLPLRADDAGKNLGSGGDFTVNSGPFVGARGMSEYWARSYASSNTASGLYRTDSVFPDSYTMSCAIHYESRHSSYADQAKTLFSASDVSGNWKIEIMLSTSSDSVTFAIKDTTNSNIVYQTVSGLNPEGGSSLLFSINSLTGDYCVYDGDDNSYSLTLTTGNKIGFATLAANFGLGCAYDNVTQVEDGWGADGGFGACYFTDSYIDFSIEDNRRLFVDALGYPVDIQQHIDSGALAEGLIRMDFSDLDDLGANLGTGGDFTADGIVTAGVDIDPNA